MGRPSPMHDPGNRSIVAAMHANGKNRQAIADEFGVHKETVSSWLQREDIKAEVDKILRDRTHRILRQVDTQIETLLQRVEKLTLKELLDIRKEFLPDRKEVTLSVNRDDVLEDLWAAAAENPEAAAALLGLESSD